MYFDSKRNRVLLADGSSVISSDSFVSKLINNIPINNLSVLPDENSKKYEYYYGEKITKELIDTPPNIVYEEDKEGDYDLLCAVCTSSDRFMLDETKLERVEKELDYFRRTGNLSFLLACYALIERFKEDGVIWGVGRGSSCASYVMYLLGIHDVDSLKYNIPFSELSKEQEDLYEQ